MNKGLRQAHGTYIWYLNAGDTLRTPDTVRTVCAALETHQPDLLYGDTMIVDAAYQDLHPRRLRPPHQLTQRSFANGMLICHQAFIPRRKLAPLYDLRYRYSADYDWCIKIIDTIKSQYRIDDYLVNYLTQPSRLAPRAASHYGATVRLVHRPDTTRQLPLLSSALTSGVASVALSAVPLAL